MSGVGGEFFFVISFENTVVKVFVTRASLNGGTRLPRLIENEIWDFWDFWGELLGINLGSEIFWHHSTKTKEEGHIIIVRCCGWIDWFEIFCWLQHSTKRTETMRTTRNLDLQIHDRKRKLMNDNMAHLQFEQPKIVDYTRHKTG